MARPTTYHDGIPDLVRQYAETYESAGNVLPTIEGLADFLDCAPSTLYLWRQKGEHPEFSEALGRLLGKQKRLLFEKALVGEYNATIAKLGLSANHGMIETTAKELSGPDGGAIETSEVRIVFVDGDDD